MKPLDAFLFALSVVALAAFALYNSKSNQEYAVYDAAVAAAKEVRHADFR